MGNYFKNWGKTRSVAFWICCGVAVLSIIGAVYYIATINGLIGPSGSVVDIIQWSAVWCVIGGVVAFIVLSLFNLANYGAAAMGILDLIAVCLIASPSVVSYVSGNMMGGEYVNNPLKIPGLMDIIISAVILVVAAVLANVFAWVHLKKKAVKEADAKAGGKNGSGSSNGSGSKGALQQAPTNQYGGQYGNQYGGTYGGSYGGFNLPPSNRRQ
ncbi:MAG: hypothetical protein LUD50_03385 [Clostridia bacterium]|nr:hypothetical protein [Clostridia bacterium]